MNDYNALVLNADWKPLSYFPLSTWNFNDTVKNVLKGSVTVVETYKDVVFRSKHWEYAPPSIVALNKYIKRPNTVAFTRFNVFLRDEFTCQYCDAEFKATASSTNGLTFEHVWPRCKGGKTTWENIVAACHKCNREKGDKIIQPRRKPFAPNAHQLREISKKFPPNYLHESWKDYVYWDSPLEE